MLPRVAICLWVALLPSLLLGSPALPLLPPFDGKISGDLLTFGATEDRKLSWSITTSSPHSGQRVGVARLAGRGIDVRATARMDAANLATTWEIDEANIALASWFAPLAARYAPKIGQFSVEGALTLAGQGSFNAADSALAGQLRAQFLNTRVADTSDSWSISGISGEVTLPDLPKIATAPRQRVAFTEARFGEQKVVNGLLEFQITSSTRVEVQTARLAAYGGTLLLEPFTYDVECGVLNVAAAVEGIDLKDLQPFFADSVKEAQGRLSGRVELRWTAEGGLQFGKGELKLTNSEAATVYLARLPGFLSSKVPREIDLLPQMPGWIRNMVRKPNPAFHALQRIELGEEALTVETLVAQLQEADANGQSKTLLQIVARPSSTETARAVKRLRLNVNLNAPLAEILKYGSDGRLSFSP